MAEQHVYDDEDTKRQFDKILPPHEQDQIAAAAREGAKDDKTLAEMEDQAADDEPEAADATTKASSPQKLLADESKPDGGPSLYKPQAQPQGKRERFNSFLQKHRKKLIAGGAGGGGLLTVLVLLIFLATSLLLPHLIDNIMAYGFTSTARNFRQSQQQILARKMGLDKMNDTAYGRLKERMIKVKKFAFFENYRPAKIAQNMHATGALQFEESAPEGFFRRTKITAIIINGERISVTQPRWYTPFRNTSESFRLAGEVNAALMRSNRGMKGMVGSIIRTRTGIQILQQIGVRGLFAWVNRGEDYKNKSPREQDLLQQQESRTRVKTRPQTPPLVDDVREAANAVDEARTQAVQEKGADALAMLDHPDEDPPRVQQVIAESLQPSVTKDIIGVASSAYAIAVPLCIVLDASMQRSGPTMDATGAALQKDFMYAASASDQYRAGDISGEAYGALARRFNGNGTAAQGDILQIASGGNPNTLNSMMPVQASNAGDFSLLNFVLPPSVADAANSLGVDGVCGALTNVWVGIATGVGEIVAGFFTGGSYTAISKAGTTTIRHAVVSYLGKVAVGILSKKSASKFVKTTVAVSGLALLAYALTAQHSGSVDDGTSRGSTAVNHITAGGALMDQSISQAMGGRAQTAEEAAQNSVDNRLNLQSDAPPVAFFDRYLSPSNPQSLLARTAIAVGGNMNKSIVASFLSMVSNIFNPTKITGLFAVGLSQKAAAASSAGGGWYGIVPVSFSQAELKVIEGNSSYWDLLENDLALENNADAYNNIKATYSRCFTDSWGTLLSEGLVMRNEDGSVMENQGLCSPNNLGRPLNSADIYAGRTLAPTFASSDAEKVFRWRISMRADKVMSSMEEIQNPGVNYMTSTLFGSSPVRADGYAFPLDPKQTYSSVPCNQYTCHWDGSPAIDLLNDQIVGQPVFALSDGVIEKLNIGEGTCRSVQFVSSLDKHNYFYGHITNVGRYSNGQFSPITSSNLPFSVKAGEQFAVVDRHKDQGGDNDCNGTSGTSHLHIDRCTIIGHNAGNKPGTDGYCRDPALIELMNSIWRDLH